MDWNAEHGIVLGLWALWCLLHSVLVDPAVTSRLEKRRGDLFAFYRPAYNLFSLLTVLPLAGWTLAIDSAPVLRWSGPLRLVQACLLAAAVFLFAAGAREYPLRDFLGIPGGPRKEKEGRRLATRGILGAIRHPWYAGGILLLWAREAGVFGLAWNLLLSAYFVAGAFHEEHTLLELHGEAYRRYRGEVSMFFPWKWLRRRMKRNAGTGA
ncbi:MAG: NnrU family protein [Desulfobacterales bacterium]